ncbi:vacuolar membrane-associated protein iml1, partial [Ascosphaera atra]
MVSAEDVIPRADNDPPIIAGHPTSSVHGNILEAINVASSYLEYEHSGRDLTRTGTSVIVITPGPGVFEVAYDALALTSEVLTSRAIGLDLICLSPQPLHAVPLFKYKPPAQPRTDRPQSPNKTNGLSAQNSFTSVSASPPRHMDTSHGADDWVYGMPHWIDISFWDPKVYHETGMAVNRIMRSSIPGTITKQSQMFTPRVRMYEIQMMGIMESEQSNISIPYLTGPESVSNKPSRDATGLRHHLEATNVPIGSLCCSSDGEMLLASKRLTKTFMESYDKQAFHTGLKRRNIQQPRHDDRGMFDPSSIRVPEKQHAHHVQRPRRPDPRALLSDHRPPVSRSGPLHVNTNEPKPGMKSSMKAPGSRSSGLSRKISFALRGLGPTPPRAVASTEINAENASAMTPLTQQTHMSNSKSQDPLSSSISKPTVEPTFSRPQASQRAAAPPRVKRQSISQPSEPTPARPISIRQNVGKSKQTDESEGARSYETRSYGTSLAPTLGSSPYAKHDAPLVQSRVFPFRRTGPKLEPPAKAIHPTTDPVKALAPWIISINPCRRKGPVRPSWFGRWQHVYARMPHASSVKWKSLKSPAILPLTTEEFPTKEELASDYSQTPYRVGENDESETREDKKSREALLAEMIGLRLSHGFQIVVGRAVEHTTGQASLGTLNIFNTAALSEGGLPIFMTMGNIIHRLVCVGGGEIEVTRYTRKNSTLFMDQTNLSTSYTPAVKTILSIQYCKSTVSLRMPKEDYNWNYVDSYIAGYRDHLWDPEKQLRFWCARFVLIPVQIPTHVRRPMLSLSEDNEEEIHLLGINQLTRMWQKNRYVLPEEKRILSKYRKEVQNPLNIIFQTSNPSE